MLRNMFNTAKETMTPCILLCEPVAVSVNSGDPFEDVTSTASCCSIPKENNSSMGPPSCARDLFNCFCSRTACIATETGFSKSTSPGSLNLACLAALRDRNSLESPSLRRSQLFIDKQRVPNTHAAQNTHTAYTYTYTAHLSNSSKSYSRLIWKMHRRLLRSQAALAPSTTVLLSQSSMISQHLTASLPSPRNGSSDLCHLFSSLSDCSSM